MKFNLTTSGCFYDESDYSRGLRDLGFEFNDESTMGDNKLYLPSGTTIKIEINTLEDLMKFNDEWGELIISGDSIEIYDDYRE